MTRTVRTALTTIGVIAVIVGAVFAGQGANLLPGSSMTGDPKWLYIGLVVLVVGVVLVGLGLRRRGGSRGR